MPRNMSSIQDMSTTSTVTMGLPGIISFRVRQRHRICGYCLSELKTASSLRRHIRESRDHGLYHLFLRLLYKYDEPLSPGKMVDPWDLQTYGRLEEKVKREAEPQPATLPQGTQNTSREEATDVSSLLAVIGSLGHSVLYSALSKASLSCLAHCPPLVRAIWEEVGGMPHVFASSQVYYGDQRHQDRSLFVQYLSSAHVRLFLDGVEDTRQRSLSKKELMFELAWRYRDPAPSDTRISASFFLEKDRCLHIPRSAMDPLGQREEETEVILTSKGGITDLHIDNGKCVVSSPVEQSRRLFFLWPPTTHNLAVMESWGSRGERLLNCCQDLEGGLIQVMTSNDALRMRSGVIHAVVTLVGGCIVTKAYIDEQTLSPMSSWLAGSPSLVRQMSDAQLEIIAHNWIEAAEIAPVSGLIPSWEAVEPLLVHAMRTQTKLRKRARNFWTNAIGRCKQERSRIDEILRALR